MPWAHLKVEPPTWGLGTVAPGETARFGGTPRSPSPPTGSLSKAPLCSDLTGVGSVPQMLGSSPTIRALPSVQSPWEVLE